MKTIKPGLRLAAFLALLAVAAFVLELSGQDSRPLLLLLAVPGWEILTLLRWRAPELKRSLPPYLSVGRATEVTLTLRDIGKEVAELCLLDACPDWAGSDQPVMRWHPQGQSEWTCRYRLLPRQRGKLEIPECWVRVRTRVGLFWKQWQIPHASASHVYPDFGCLQTYRLLTTLQQRPLFGIRMPQRRGQGTSFLQLREYREGDTLRQLDWKATARRQQLISREYQDERDQRIAVLLDSGRRMRTLGGELSYFDACLNSSLMLADVALRQGDGVTVLPFSEESRWLGWCKGHQGMNHLLNQTFTLAPSAQASDYLKAAQFFLQKQRRRCLVILITCLRDDDLGMLLQACQLLKSRHRLMLANLREPVVEALLREPVLDMASADSRAGAILAQRQRRALQDRVRAEGVEVLDCPPTRLSRDLVVSYHRLKRSGVW